MDKIDDNKQFYVVSGDRVARPKLKPKPTRFENQTTKRLTAEELEEKQRLATERKQKHDAMKIQQAQKVSQQAFGFDQLEKQQAKKQDANKKWFSSAMQFK